MQVATLALIVRDGALLLGEKKRGEIGTGILSGPGGKLGAGEEPAQGLVRETKEELSIALDPHKLERVALITFYSKGDPDFYVHVYKTDFFSGELGETEDMVPRWHPISSLPYERMYEADRYWMPHVFVGERFVANVFYRGRAKDLERFEIIGKLPAAST